MRDNLKDEVAKRIRDDILAGTLTPGSRIDQLAVGEALGVSRLPVREALIMLEVEGLVDNIARRGSFVAAVSPDDIRDHFAMFGLLAGLAAERAAELIDDQDLSFLRTNTLSMEATDDPRELDRLNFAFHRHINRRGSSRRLKAVLRLLANNMPSHFFEYQDEPWKARAVGEHWRIYKALEARDGPEAATAFADHFRSSGDQAVLALRSSGFWATDGTVDA
jgi:DNA-binding GntR family transcriptional regulator